MPNVEIKLGKKKYDFLFSQNCDDLKILSSHEICIFPPKKVQKFLSVKN